jgi:membrane protease YdiL (CAAX protease family)
MPAPQWDAFLVVTGLVLALFLGLARLSAGPVRDSTPSDDHRAVTPAGVDPGVGIERVDVAIGDRGPALEGISSVALLANVAVTQALFGGVVLGTAVVFAIPADALGAGSLLADLLGPPLVAGLGLGAVLWALSDTASRVVDARGIDHDESLRELLAPEGVGGWLLLLCVILPLIAGVEELLFRAAAIGAVAAGTGVSPWLLAVVSSVAFGAGHSAQGRAGVALTGVIGFALAAAYVLTGSFVTVFLAHYVLNAVEFLVHER